MQSIALLLWLALCSEQDVRERRISDALTLGVGAGSLAWLFATGHSWIGAEASDVGWGLAIVMLLTLPSHHFGHLESGDVKLMAALSLATSYLYVLGTAIGAGLTVLIWLAVRRRLWRLLSVKWKKRLKTLIERIGDKQPFAPFVLTGFLLAAVWTQ